MDKKYTLLFVLCLQVGIVCGQQWHRLKNCKEVQRPMTYSGLCFDTTNTLYTNICYYDSVSFLPVKYGFFRWDAAGRNWLELVSYDTATYPSASLCSDSYGNIYAGNIPGTSGNSSAAKWDGTKWNRLGAGALKSISCDKGPQYLYGIKAGSHSDSVMKWDGASWRNVGYLMNFSLSNLCLNDSMDLYASGEIPDTVGSGIYIAKYDHATHEWSRVGSSFYPIDSLSLCPMYTFSIFTDTANCVYAIVKYRELVLHGIIPTYTDVYKWDGIRWRVLGVSRENRFDIICKGEHGIIYGAGEFKCAGGRYCVAKYDPNRNEWSELGRLFPGSEISQSISTLCTNKLGEVYTAGRFQDSLWPRPFAYFPIPFVAAYNNGDDCPELIDSIINIPIKIYPNPASRIVYFEFPLSANTTIRLCDMTGRQIGQWEVVNGRQASIDVERYSDGMYLCQIINEKTRTISKLVIRR